MNEATNAAPYLRIAAEIRRRIQTGELRPGDRVPSTRGLVQEFGVAMATATKALATLQQDGVVHSLPGVGTVVGPPPRATEPPRPWNRVGCTCLSRHTRTTSSCALYSHQLAVRRPPSLAESE